MSNKFLYFAYASNLSSKRLHKDITSARRIGIGKLRDFDITFSIYSKRWNGASATLITKSGKIVWGAVWEIDNEQRDLMHRQEGVHSNLYVPIDVEIETLDGRKLTCLAYQQKNPPEDCNLNNLSDERKPSPVYLQTIISGAIESGLPEEYIAFLQRIPHNGYEGNANLDLDLLVTQ